MIEKTKANLKIGRSIEDLRGVYMRRTGGVARVRFDGNDIIDFQVTSMVDEGSLVRSAISARWIAHELRRFNLKRTVVQ